jgi:hypothetical protein
VSGFGWAGNLPGYPSRQGGPVWKNKEWEAGIQPGCLKLYQGHRAVSAAAFTRMPLVFTKAKVDENTEKSVLLSVPRQLTFSSSE